MSGSADSRITDENDRGSPVQLKGAVLPFYRGQPFVLHMTDKEHPEPFVVVFSDMDKLAAFMSNPLVTRHYGSLRYIVKKVDDPADFCASIWESGGRIMLNPRAVNEHKTLWTEIVPALPAARDGGAT